MANKVSKVCNIDKLIIPVLECDDVASNAVAPMGKKNTNYNFIDAVNAAIGEFPSYNSDALAAAGGVAVGALAGTYFMIRHSLDRHSEEAKNIANWARDSKTSAEDIQNLIDSPEFDGGPGIWTSIGGWIKVSGIWGSGTNIGLSLLERKLRHRNVNR